jgi:NAD+ diphosphatase
MKHAETVTFGGSSLDRAADLRGDDAARAFQEKQHGASTLVMWRGKPLVCGPARDRLARLPVDHAVLAADTGTKVLLGRAENGALIHAHDLSAWQPDGLDDSEFDKFVDGSEQSHPGLPEDAVFVELRRVMTHLDARDAELAATARAVLGWHDSHRFCARCGAESELVMSGWQRSCPSCRGQHFPRTDPVVIMLITHGNSVLLGRSPGWPEGMYSLLAGFVEPGETIEAAVRREVYEESGIAVGDVTYLASQPWAFPSSLMFGCLGRALSREITIDPNEIEDAIWVSRDDMLSAFAGQHPVLMPARKGAIAQFLLRNWLADTLD